MSKRMERIRKWYKVPVKRGTHVRVASTKQTARVLSSDGNYLYIRDAKRQRLGYHPFDLDYWDGEKWLLGKDFKTKHDSHIDMVNARWNRTYAWKNRDFNVIVSDPIEL